MENILDSEISIKVSNVNKKYKLYSKSIHRLKESINIFGKKYHHDFSALNDISFEIRKGETVGIIGRNGSGKSTLLKIITGVLTQTSGEVCTEGRIAALLELGAGFNPEMTGLENIYFNGSVMGFSSRQIDEKLDEIISFADIGEFIHQPVKMYSSGMFVRLAFAVSINVDPEILIIDEALAVGDMNFQAKCYNKFREFQQAGKTILFVSHSLDTIVHYCSRAILLDSGSKITEGSPKDVVDVYKQILADCFDNPTKSTYAEEKDEKPLPETETMLKRFEKNPESLEYGEKQAEIIDYGIFDSKGFPTQKLINGQIFEIVFKVRFNETVENPIFAFTLKNIKGLELTGTNSYMKQSASGVFKKDEIVTVRFSQKLNIQGGTFSLSLGCTCFGKNGINVFHRLYDILLFEVINDIPFVGFYDLGSDFRIQRGGS